MTRRILLGAIAGPHGVRGAVKVKTFTANPEDIAAYGPLSAEDGRRFTLKVVQVLKGDLVLATAKEVKDRTAAEALSGTKLYVERSRLPATTDEDEYYHEDLIGLAAQADDGTALGRVAAVHNFGAGDILEIASEDAGAAGKTRLIPFTRAAAPHVDLASGVIVVARAALAEPGDGPPPAEDPVLCDEHGQIVSDDARVNADAIRAEDA